MNCTEAYRFICDNLDENIRSARCRAIRRHIESCPNCKAYLDSIKKTVTLYRTIPGPNVPPGTHRKVIETLNSELARFGKHAPRKPTRVAR
jgi:predicted anti-sigma-YlaC factor YlaD